MQGNDYNVKLILLIAFACKREFKVCEIISQTPKDARG